ncbi:isoprenylcysteine carboxylmethyltransferase family protein [Sulfitobacter sp.]|nr:isoprenylcysteine carboxylmethyltransferase family protein [Sulfitobacter sp.]
MNTKRFLRMPPVAQMLFLSGLIYILSIIAGPQEFPFAVRCTVALTSGVTAAILLVLSIASFRKHKTTVDPLHPEQAQTLVTTGVFRITRNPMYVAMALWLIAVCMIADSLLGLMLVPLFVINLTFNQIRMEEAAMEDLFGQDYQEYLGRTPRWLLL